MMNRIVLIAFAVLLSFTILFGYLSYKFHAEKAVAVGELRVAQESLKTAQKAYETKDLSCKIDDTSVVEVEKEKKELQTKVETLSEQIANLKTGITKKPTIIITQKENSQVEKQNEVLVGSELLSDDLKRLLNSSYCSVETNDPSCTTGQPSN